jgi:hypothetical protein
MDKIVGLHELGAWLTALGRRAEVVPFGGVDWLDGGFFSRDRSLLRLANSTVDVVAIRMQGAVGPRQNLEAGAFTFAIGGLPVASTQVLPLQYHYLVREAAASSAFSAKLAPRWKGWFSRERVGFGWKGGELAEVLARDAWLLGCLHAWLPVDDEIRVVPEPSRGFVRVVHKRAAVLRYSLFSQEIVQFYRGYLPEALIVCFERIAWHVRAFGAGR